MWKREYFALTNLTRKIFREINSHWSNVWSFHTSESEKADFTELSSWKQRFTNKRSYYAKWVIDLTKYFLVRENFSFFHTVSLSALTISKNFREINLNIWLGIVSQNVKKYSKTSRFLRKKSTFFRQINVFTKEVTKELITRIFFWAWLLFILLFHTG